MTLKRCNRCHRPMKGTTAYDGACECGGLIEAAPPEENESLFMQALRKMCAEYVAKVRAKTEEDWKAMAAWQINMMRHNYKQRVRGASELVIVSGEAPGPPTFLMEETLRAFDQWIPIP